MIVLIFMLLFGLGFAVLVGNVLHENDAPLIMSLVFLLFMVGWIGAALYMLVYHIRNIKKQRGLPLFEMETEAGSSGVEGETRFDRKLRDLEQLKMDDLLSQEEYSRKRAEIMGEKW